MIERFFTTEGTELSFVNHACGAVNNTMFFSVSSVVKSFLACKNRKPDQRSDKKGQHHGC